LWQPESIVHQIRAWHVKTQTAPHKRESSDTLKHDCNSTLPHTLEETLQPLSNCSNIVGVGTTIQPNLIKSCYNKVLQS